MKRFKIMSVLFSTILLSPAVLLASEKESIFPSMGRLTIALAVVLALVYVCIHLFRKFILKSGGPASGNIKHRGSFSLSQKARICVVDVGERTFLLGVTDSQVSHIAELDRSELCEDEDVSKGRSFVEHLGIFRDKRGGREVATG